jgi:C1A family cysteine protease
VKILIALFLAIIMIVPAALSADTPLQMAPLNPDFIEYQQRKNMRSVSVQEPNYGYIPPSVDLSYIESLRNQSDNGTFPATFSWLTTDTNNRVTAVKNQGSFCGTCWAHGNIAVMESKAWIDGLSSNPDYSEQSLVCCTDSSWIKCIGGNDFMAQDTLIKKGAGLEECQVYNDGIINAQGCMVCPVYQTTNFVWVAVTDNTTEAINAIKSAVQFYGPVTVSYFDSSSNLYSDNITNNVYYYNGSSNQNHLVSIVGWDDTIPHPVGGGFGAWLTKNSWGTAWGNGGYFWLCYGKSNATDFGSLRSVKAYDSNEKLYYLDESGWDSDWNREWYSNFGWADNYSWVANKFTATDTGNLTHVDFYTLGVNTQYDIRVHKSGDVNNLGVIYSQSVGVCDSSSGYYSIPVNPVFINDGEDFIIVVKFITPECNYPIPVERIRDPMPNPPIQTGRSYAAYNSGTWWDLGEYGMNACLRARVHSTPKPVSDTINLTTTVVYPISTISFSLSSTSLNFGSVAIGSCSASQNITVTNIGNVPITITAIPSTGFYANSLKLNGGLAPVGGWETPVIFPEGVVVFSVQVCPSAGSSLGEQTGVLTFMADPVIE